MTINTQALGPNSGYVAYTGGETLSSVMGAVEAYITAHGWTVHDAAAGTNAVAYKAAISGAGTFKYVLLDWNTTDTVVIKTFETWNASTHVGTNEGFLKGLAGSSTSRHAQQVDLANGGYLYLFVTARYLIALSRKVVNGAWGSDGLGYFSGCAEFSLDTGEAAGTYPSFGAVSSECLSGRSQLPQVAVGFNDPIPPYNHLYRGFAELQTRSSVNVGFNYLGVPRTTSGEVGELAENMINVQALYAKPSLTAQGVQAVYNTASYPAATDSATLAAANGNGYHQIVTSNPLSVVLPTGDNPATALPWCVTPTILEMQAANCNKVATGRGRLFGIKYAGMGKGWNLLDKVDVNVDADLFHVTSGAVNSHYYLGDNIIIPG